MKYFYEFVKTMYFVLTIFVGVFFLRGNILFPRSYSQIVIYLMPGYLILCGLMIGYIIAQMWSSIHDDESKTHSIFLKSFIIGILIGLSFSLVYVFL